MIDLSSRHGPPGGTKPSGDAGGILPGVVDDLDQDVDDQQRIERQGGSGSRNLKLPPRRDLGRRFLPFRAQVEVDILEPFPRDGPGLDQAPERVVHAQAETLLEFLVRLPCR